MRVVVVGAGEVGSSIAASLAETHEVVVMDVDPERVESLTYSHDVLAIEGDGTSLSALEEAEVGRADMVIASTDDDETNLVACNTAKTITDVFTVARVRSVDYLRTWERSEGAFGVDFMVCTTLQAARDIVRVVGTPAARDVDTFARGLVRMAEFEIPESSPLDGQTVREADRFDSLTFAALLRDGDVEIPRGDTVINTGDRAVVIGSPASVEGFAAAVDTDDPDAPEDIVIVGGSEVGFQTARLLGNSGLRPQVVESDPDRAREIAESLPEVLVLEHDATDVEFLVREHVDEADAVVATLESDEKNLLVSILAKRLGAERTVAVVETVAYTDVFEAVGVDVTVNPRETTAEEITRFTREGGAEKVALVENDQAEVIEIEVGADSTLAGRPLSESVADLPDGVVIGAVIRDDEFVTPRGDTVIDEGDSVVVFVDGAVVEEVTPLL
ncbi:MAG: Trk system potassium transporter TrkA [Halobacteriaceae archaeon]